jgi:hypothetical protein
VKIFYTYMWLREDGTPYYVGKGSYKSRAYEGHKVGNRTQYAPDKAFVLIQEFPTEEDAFEAEKFLISYYGRKDLGVGILRNQTNGGEGATGTSEGHRKQAAALKGRPFSEEHKRKISESKKGNQARQGIRKTYCKRGHEFTVENTYLAPRGSRECMTCKKERDAVSYLLHV